MNNGPVTNFERVREFHEYFGVPQSGHPHLLSQDREALRIELIREEFQELVDALDNKDLVEAADALTDLLVVVYGAGLEMGIDLDACFLEVHRSNMSKLGADGKPLHRSDGKVMKGPNFSPPDLVKVLDLDHHGQHMDCGRCGTSCW